MRTSKKEKLQKSKERVSKYGEVYTPEWLVKKMCDMLEEENKGEDAFGLDKTILEPACGNGNFLVEILSRKIQRCKNENDLIVALDTIYGIDILPDNVEESKKRMLDIIQSEFGFFAVNEAKIILDKRIICGNSLEIMRKLEEGYEWGQW